MKSVTSLLSRLQTEALKHPNILLGLAAIPIYSFSKALITNLIDLSQDLFLAVPNLPKRYGAGSWAVVTGASDGIGKEFCLQLASQRINVVLIARNKEKTEKVANEIREHNPGVLTRVVIRDFVHSLDEGFFDDLYNEIRDLDISILVNNVGTGDLTFFEKSSEKGLKEMIILNCGAITLLSRKVIPQMLIRKGKSAIINLSSAASFRPLPFMSLYSATKVFDDYLSRALALEFDEKIDILSMTPSFIRTPLASGSGDSFFHINTDEFVISTLKKLGRTNQAIGSWKHVLKRKRELLLATQKKMVKGMRNWALHSETLRAKNEGKN